MSSGAIEPTPAPFAAGAGDRPAGPPAAASAPADPRPAVWNRVASRARGFLGRARGLSAALLSAPDRPRRLWDRLSVRARGSLGPATTAQAGPLTLQSPTAVQAEPEAPRSRAERVKKTSREQRWERRRRRRFGEEVLGWILVPIILLSCYWAVKSGLTALGTTPTALIQGIKAAASGKV